MPLAAPVSNYIASARRIAAVTPGARSDPFFINRLVSHFVYGVDQPGPYMPHVLSVEKQRRAEVEKAREEQRRVAMEGKDLLPEKVIVSPVARPRAPSSAIQAHTKREVQVVRKRSRKITSKQALVLEAAE